MDSTKTARRNRTRAVAAALLGAALALSAVAAATPAAARPLGHSTRSGASPSKTRGQLFFHSPSKNIYCVVFKYRGKATGRCDIKQRDWTAPQRPRSCHLDYGNGAEVGAHGDGRYTCAGDTVLGQGHRALRYGHAARLGAIKCSSRRTGMTCRNVKTGHGFTLSREAVAFF
jgi:Family of unknown function (DUF6636)